MCHWSDHHLSCLSKLDRHRHPPQKPFLMTRRMTHVTSIPDHFWAEVQTSSLPTREYVFAYYIYDIHALLDMISVAIVCDQRPVTKTSSHLLVVHPSAFYRSEYIIIVHPSSSRLEYTHTSIWSALQLYAFGHTVSIIFPSVLCSIDGLSIGNKLCTSALRSTRTRDLDEISIEFVRDTS